MKTTIKNFFKQCILQNLEHHMTITENNMFLNIYMDLWKSLQ